MEDDRTSLSIKPFDGKELDRWKVRMKFYFRKKGWSDLIDKPVPSKRNQITEWIDADVDAMNFIICKVADQYLHLIEQKSHAKEMWDVIVNTFSENSHQKLADLRSSLFLMTFKVGGNLLEYIVKFRETVSQMKGLGDNLQCATTFVSCSSHYRLSMHH